LKPISDRPTATITFIAQFGPIHFYFAMMDCEQDPAADDGNKSNLLALALLAPFVGALVGFLSAIFRLALQGTDSLRDRLIAWAHGETFAGLLFVIALCAAATAVAAWLVRRYSPFASGSGIPHVELVLKGELPQAPYWLIPIKFFGGLLAIGAGLALGREGPSVQMGASLANLLARLFQYKEEDCRALLAAGAGAGLATAFNAPIAGGIFVLEELVRRFDTRIAIATFGASAGAIAVARLFLGDTPDFRVEPLPYPSFGTVPVHLIFGILAGLFGVAYNCMLLGALAAVDKLRRWPVELRAAVVGAGVGMLAWFAPGLVGGGDQITQLTLSGTQTAAVVSMVFVLRFGLGAISYSALTPGGLFAPMLVLGAQLGFLYAKACPHWFPSVAADPTSLAIVGMAAFFTAVVRAPMTGIILIIEMTSSFTMLLPMLTACFASMAVPTLLGNAPIYDSLRLRLGPNRRTEINLGRQP
jgi:chloride channel protein, CIC family